MLTFTEDMKICIDQEIGDFFNRDQFISELEYAFCYSEIDGRFYDAIIIDYRIYNSPDGKTFYIFKGKIGNYSISEGEVINNLEYHAFVVSKIRFDSFSPFFDGIRWSPLFSLSKMKQIFLLTDF